MFLVWKPQKIKFKCRSNPQKAHLGIIVEICIKFGEASMHSNGVMLRAKCLPQRVTVIVMFPWKSQKMKFMCISNPQKAHIGIVVYMHTKFGKASMHSNRVKLCTK